MLDLKAFSVLLIISDVNGEIMKCRVVSKLKGPVGTSVTNMGSQIKEMNN